MGTWIWYRLHKNLAYFVFIMGVGFKAVNSKFNVGLYPIDPYYWLLCTGAAVSTFLTLCLRILNHPAETRKRADKINYVIVLFLAFVLQALPAISGPYKERVFFVVLPVFFMSSLVASTIFCGPRNDADKFANVDNTKVHEDSPN